MKKDLVKLMRHLSESGHSKEATLLSSVIKKADDAGDPIFGNVGMDEDDDKAGGPLLSASVLSEEQLNRYDEEIDKAEESGELLSPHETILNWIEIIEAAEAAKELVYDPSSKPDEDWIIQSFMEEGVEIDPESLLELRAITENLARINSGKLDEIRLKLQDALVGKGVLSDAGKHIKDRQKELSFAEGLQDTPFGRSGEEIAEASNLINELIKTSDALDRSGMSKESDSVDKAINILAKLVK